MAWLYLFIAGLFEAGWAIGLKYTEGDHVGDGFVRGETRGRVHRCNTTIN